MSSQPLTILFFGDIVGRLGRRALATALPALREKYQADLVFANGENMAHGRGFTPTTADEVLASGVDYLTSGDHCFDQHAFVDECFNGNRKILRPANYQIDAPGKGYDIINLNGQEILLMNLIGRSFMPKHYDDPFRTAQTILEGFTDKKFSAIIVDIHAETTAEKIALRHFLDGKISALLGTHTHVPTADAQVTKQGTGYITDLGMTGDADGVIGIVAKPVVASFLSQTKIDHELAADGCAQVNGVCLAIDPDTGRCLDISLIQESVIIPPSL